jgi:hypothetical protein
MSLSHPTSSHNVRLSPRFVNSDAHGTSIVNLMGAAMDKAWADFEPRPKNEFLAKSLMESAIIEGIEANVREHVLVRKATVTLMAAIKLDPEALAQGDALFIVGTDLRSGPPTSSPLSPMGRFRGRPRKEGRA